MENGKLPSMSGSGHGKNKLKREARHLELCLDIDHTTKWTHSQLHTKISFFHSQGKYRFTRKALFEDLKNEVIQWRDQGDPYCTFW